MGKIISNGIEYVGLTNVNGAFIDTDNVIYTNVSSASSESYTATEDCYIMQDVACGGSNVATIQINGVTVAEYYYSGNTFIIPYTVLLKKGQILSVTHGVSTSHTVNVYGVQQGSTSQGSSGGIDYSTTEQKTGQKWIDGKDIYQKTYVTITDTRYDSENAYLIGTIPNGLDNVVDFEGSLKTSDGYGYSSLNGIGDIANWNFGIHISNTNLLLYGGSSFSSLPQNATCIVTIKYTKSTT